MRASGTSINTMPCICTGIWLKLSQVDELKLNIFYCLFYFLQCARKIRVNFKNYESELHSVNNFNWQLCRTTLVSPGTIVSVPQHLPDQRQKNNKLSANFVGPNLAAAASAENGGRCIIN